MATWLSFAPWVRPSVPGCPDPMIERAVCDAAIEFCEQTQAFVEAATLTTQVGKASYDVVSDAGVPGMVLSATLGNRTLHPVYVEVLSHSIGDTWRTDTGKPAYYLADFEDQVHVYPIPTEAETGTLTLAARPSRNDTEWDDRLFERYGEIIADGALARLLNQVSVPWSEPNAALQRRQRFQQGINKVRAKAFAAYTPAAVTAQFHRV